MKIIPTKIQDLLIIEPHVHEDDRGFFFESYNKEVFRNSLGLDANFVQDNHSKSNNGVLRGLHYQKKPYEQGKLVRVISGEVYDVAVDLRINSLTYGKWEGVLLNSQNKRMFWIPEGFAHGFVVTSKEAEFLYKTTNFYNPQSELAIKWDDPDLAIKWPIMDKIISLKDSSGLFFRDIQI